MKKRTLINLIASFVGGIILVTFIMTQRAESHDCGGNWQDGYIQAEPDCYQQAYADAYGNITYITVCN